MKMAGSDCKTFYLRLYISAVSYIRILHSSSCKAVKQEAINAYITRIFSGMRAHAIYEVCLVSYLIN